MLSILSMAFENCEKGSIDIAVYFTNHFIFLGQKNARGDTLINVVVVPVFYNNVSININMYVV